MLRLDEQHENSIPQQTPLTNSLVGGGGGGGEEGEGGITTNTTKWHYSIYHQLFCSISMCMSKADLTRVINS